MAESKEYKADKESGFPESVILVRLTDDGDAVVTAEGSDREQVIPKANFAMYYTKKSEKPAAAKKPSQDKDE